MKKFYTVLAAAAVVVSASALNLNVERAGQLKTFDSAQKEIVKGKSIEHGVVSAQKVEKVGMRMVKANAGESTSIEGTWLFQLGDYYFEESTGPYTMEIEASFVDGGRVFFEDPSNYVLPFVASYNETAGTLTFNSMTLGQLSGYYVIQQPYVYDYDEGIVPQNIVAKHNGNTIVFEPDNGLAWVASVDDAGRNTAGYFDILDLEGATKVGGDSAGGEESDGSWSDMGNATMVDGWICPAYGLSGAEATFDVPLQCSNDTPGLYRLVDPYHSVNFPLISNNSSRTTGYIVFDVNDPDHVVFLKSNAGFANSQLGITELYCYNMLGFYVERYGVDAADFAKEIEADGEIFPFTTFKDGVVELKYVLDEDNSIFNDTNFGIQGATTGGYGWQTNTGESVDMSAKIIFPEDWAGVKNVTVAETNAPVEYFNLQGVRVANPESGLYIRRQGNSVSKVQVK